MRKANISIFKILRNQKIALSRLRLTEAMAANILKENSRCDGNTYFLICPAALHMLVKRRF